MRYNGEDVTEGAKIAAFMILFIIIVVFMLNGCATAKKVDPETCVVNATDKTCWLDKSLGTGTSFPAMDGYFCMDSANMANILEHLSECKYMP